MEQNEVLKALQRNHAAELKLAAERLEGTARHTEIIPSKVLSDMTGHEILLHYKVKEASVRAVAAGDNGRVWEDACVEFFVSPDGDDCYYNFECNCIGRLLVQGGAVNERRPTASPEVLGMVKRWSSLGTEPFEERLGECSWELVMVIPVSAFFKHSVGSLDGKTMKGNFYKCGDKLQTPHFLSWSPIGLERPMFHCPAFFGTLSFE